MLALTKKKVEKNKHLNEYLIAAAVNNDLPKRYTRAQLCCIYIHVIKYIHISIVGAVINIILAAATT